MCLPSTLGSEVLMRDTRVGGDGKMHGVLGSFLTSGHQHNRIFAGNPALLIFGIGHVSFGGLGNGLGSLCDTVRGRLRKMY